LKLALAGSGLGDEETAFFIEALKRPDGSIFDTAQRAGIGKDRAYKIYGELEQKGLLTGSEDGKYKKIHACSIQGYLEGLYRKGRQFYQAADRLKEVRPFLSFINSKEDSSLARALDTENLASDWVDFAAMDWEKTLIYGNFEMIVETMGKDADIDFVKTRLKRGKQALPILSTIGPYTIELALTNPKEMRRTKFINSDKLQNSFIMILPEIKTVNMWTKDPKSGLVSGLSIKDPVLTSLHEDTFKYFDSVSDSQFSQK